MQLTAGEFQIRDLVDEDVVSITRYANNPRVAGVLRDLFPHPYFEKDAREFISRTNAQTPRKAFAIATTEEAFGVIGYIPGLDVYRFSAEIGYWIGEPFWGQGIMTSVVETFCDFLFDSYQYNRLCACIFSSNPASGRVLEKAGFTREGIIKAHVVKNGELLDEHMYSRLRPGLLAR
jgi:ribosomal-protein-alanine N-acetyltransferase